MADSEKTRHAITSPFQSVEVEEERSNTQEYLRMLLDRERQINTLRNAIRDLELALERERGRNSEKDQTINDLRAENAELRKNLETENSRHRTGNTTPGIIVPLPTFDSAGPDDDPIAHPITRTRTPHHKQVRIDDDVVARLKNDRKAYPAVCDKALHYWQLLANVDLVDHRLKPTSRCGVTVMARIVSRMQTEVDPAISWAFFERYWKCDHLQSNLHRETHRHRSLYAVVNRIFGLPDDAPYLTKSSQAV